MIIKKLSLTNFGVYAGSNVFEFTNSAPIALIGGMNGRGKTTFLNAVLLALYGANSSAYKESGYKSYGRYLHSLVNTWNINQTASVELDFLMDESTGAEYSVCREWDGLAKRTEETLTVMENGTFNEFLTNNWPMFVENILPSALSRFFFFDGEKIAELAVDETNEEMKESIRSMLGISVLDVLKHDLEKSLRRLSKSGSEGETTQAIEALRQERQELEFRLSEIEANADALQKKIDEQTLVIDELHHRYEVKGGAVIEQKEGVIRHRSELQTEIEANQEQLVDCAAGELPLVLVKDLIADIKLQAEDEHNDLVLAQAAERMDLMLENYTSLFPEDGAGGKRFMDFIKSTMSEEKVDTVYSVSDHALFQLNALLDASLKESKKKAAFLLEKKRELQKQLDEVESYLNLDINEKELQDLFASIREQEIALVSLERELSAINQEKGAINQAYIIKSAEYSRTVESFLQNAEQRDDQARMAKYATMALRISEEYTVRLQKRKTDVLANTVMSCHRMLSNKTNLIESIKIDPETLDLSYYDGEGKIVEKTSLSAGEKQLMVIAILWALAICSKKKLPVIIDTPLSRLDSRHRTALVTTYFPNASAQTIILSTDTEINQEYYEMMKDSIGDEFTLFYSEEEKSTTILKGYDPGK